MAETHPSATVWAREFPVSVTENSLTLSVGAITHGLRPLGKGAFRGFLRAFSEKLTHRQPSSPFSIPNCQNQTRHGGVIFGRECRWWGSRPFSELTSVNGAIAHIASDRCSPCPDMPAPGRRHGGFHFFTL